MRPARALLTLAPFLAITAAALATNAPPPGVEQVVPRGRIAAVVEPRFVAAGGAGLPADAAILGVVIDGQARAYSLNLLIGHEVVNDRIGTQPFAAVW